MADEEQIRQMAPLMPLTRATLKEAAAVRSRVDPLYSRWVAAVRAVKADAADSLREGATPEEVGRLEARLCAPLPWEYKWFLARWNGQSDDGSLFEGQFFLGVDDAIREADVWAGVLQENPHMRSYKGADPALQPAWWCPGWLPVTADGGGQNMCIDLEPGKTGTSGQLISMDHELGPSLTPFSSFAAAIEEQADALEGGRLSWDSDMECFMRQDSDGPGSD